MENGSDEFGLEPSLEMPAKVLDMHALEALREIQPGGALVVRVVTLYLGELPKYWQGIDAAVAAGGADAVMRAAHTLKSASGNVGLVRVAALAKALELDARRGELARAETLREMLRRETASGRQALEAVVAAADGSATPAPAG